MSHDVELIYQAQDQYGTLQVIEHAGYRKLFFDSPIEQGCQAVDAPLSLVFDYQQVLLECLVKQDFHTQSTPRILMLGLGTGSIATQLLQCIPQLQMTVVELRQIVIDCAYQCFALPDIPELEVLQADALEFVIDNLHPYDAIIVDVFDDSGLPNAFSQQNFHSALWRNCKGGGQILLHLWHEWEAAEVNRPTKETDRILQFWQDFSRQHGTCELKRYNIESSRSLVLQVQNNRH